MIFATRTYSGPRYTYSDLVELVLWLIYTSKFRLQSHSSGWQVGLETEFSLQSKSESESANVNRLSPALNEFGYKERPAVTSIFFFQKRTLLIDLIVKSSATKTTVLNDEDFVN